MKKSDKIRRPIQKFLNRTRKRVPIPVVWFWWITTRFAIGLWFSTNLLCDFFQKIPPGILPNGFQEFPLRFFHQLIKNLLKILFVEVVYGFAQDFFFSNIPARVLLGNCMKFFQILPQKFVHVFLWKFLKEFFQWFFFISLNIFS